MREIIQPNKRIDSDGNERDMDSPYEQGIYFSVIGASILENPFGHDEEFNRRRFIQGFNDHQQGKLKP